jgi:sporulation protein YabP
MAQQEFTLPHRVTLNQREALTVSGVSEVLGVEETAVQLNTSMGCLWVYGQQLRLKNLNPEGGQLSLSGTVTALVYEQPKQKGGWLSRLFG